MTTSSTVPQGQKQERIKQFQTKPNDTGSTDVQVALLSARITQLTEHLKVHKHDEHTRLGLLKLVGRRQRLLAYLNRTDVGRYRSLISRLSLRR